MRSFAWFALLFAAACGGASLDGAAERTDGEATETLSRRAANTTVWIERLLVRRTRPDGAAELAIAGRASRNVNDGFAFVFDNPYGELRVVSARKFEVRFGLSELTTLAVGTQQFLRLGFAGASSGASTSLTARVLAEPVLSSFGGSGLFLDPPVVVQSGGRPVIRITGRASRDLLRVEASAGGVALSDVVLSSPRRFSIDLLVDHLAALAATRDRLTVVGRSPRGDLTKSARLDLAIADLALTDGDVETVWPPATCDDDVRACLAALPLGASDLSSCGRYLEVAACAGRVGVAVDDVALGAALARADARVNGVLRSDARALVGLDRTEAFLDGARRGIESRLEPYLGRVYPSATDRDAALDAESELGLDHAYARPLDFTDPVSPAPNDLARAHHVAADALLLHLAGLDLTQTEWARPLETLVRQFRARHVAALLELRETAPVAATRPDEDIFIVDWLDAMVEVGVLRSTGRVSWLLFEID